MSCPPALWISVTCLVVSTTSCGFFTPKGPPKAKQVMYEWNDDHGPGEVSVDIDLAKQVATYKRGERLIGWSYVSTGKVGHSTSAGAYTITEKMPVKYSDRYGWISDDAGNVTNDDATPLSTVPPGNHYSPSPMKYWMRITHYGVGLHAGDIPNPGLAESHGCVRLPRDFVPTLYEVTGIGTPVRISLGKSTSPRKRKLNG
jgi:lipoprotein-anchoring transpeptidase ErfK/SrfK